MDKKSVKLRKGATLNKDSVTKLQEDQLNKLKGGANDVSQPGKELSGSLSCIAWTCNAC